MLDAKIAVSVDFKGLGGLSRMVLEEVLVRRPDSNFIPNILISMLFKNRNKYLYPHLYPQAADQKRPHLHPSQLDSE